jgi:hypothetical protein
VGHSKKVTVLMMLSKALLKVSCRPREITPTQGDPPEVMLDICKGSTIAYVLEDPERTTVERLGVIELSLASRDLPKAIHSRRNPAPVVQLLKQTKRFMIETASSLIFALLTNHPR